MRSTDNILLRELYPALAPFKTHMMPTGDGHVIYVEECGNPDGLPVVFLHGGPGGGSNPSQRRFFDPSRYHIILFDQRGCGRSTPHASLENNTTQHLISDMEMIRNALGLQSWVILGGSWGSTLALAYAQTYPDRTLGIVLRGVFMGSQSEINWFYKSGTNALFPDKWRDFIAPIPADERDNLVRAYYHRLTHPDYRDQRMIYARAWSLWEASTVTLVPDDDEVRHSIDPRFAQAFARIESHYFHHQCFLSEDRQIQANLDKIRDIPMHIVQGRYDVICPPRAAWAIKEALPNTELRIVPVAGHSAFEPGIRHEIVVATDLMADRLGANI